MLQNLSVERLAEVANLSVRQFRMFQSFSRTLAHTPLAIRCLSRQAKAADQHSIR